MLLISCLPLLLLTLSSPVYGRAVGGTLEDTLNEVKETVDKVNFDINKRGLQVAPISDYSISLILGTVDVTRGGVGILSSLVVRRETDQHLTKNQAEDGATNTTYDVSLGFEELHLTYSYSYRWLLIFSGSGTVTVAPRSNTFRLTGKVSQQADGTCMASLISAAFTDLGAYEVSLGPEGFINTFFGFVTSLIYNHVLPSVIFSSSNDYLQDAIHKPKFQKAYSEILCKSLVQY